MFYLPQFGDNSSAYHVDENALIYVTIVYSCEAQKWQVSCQSLLMEMHTNLWSTIVVDSINISNIISLKKQQPALLLLKDTSIAKGIL